jgi:hypothetical protein
MAQTHITDGLGKRHAIAASGAIGITAFLIFGNRKNCKKVIKVQKLEE